MCGERMIGEFQLNWIVAPGIGLMMFGRAPAPARTAFATLSRRQPPPPPPRPPPQRRLDVLHLAGREVVALRCSAFCDDV